MEGHTVGLLWDAGKVPLGNHVVRGVAAYTLIATEFSYDQTCAVSSEERWVAPLKDRKEMKTSKVIIADLRSWGDISFSMGTCEP